MKKVIFALLGILIACGIGLLALILVQHNAPVIIRPTESTPGISTVPSSSAHTQATTLPAPTQTVPTEPTVPTSEATLPSLPTEPVTTLPAANPMISISLPILKETDYADDGTAIFTYTFQDVILNIPNADIAKTVTLDLLQRMDQNAQTIASLQDSAYLDYTGQDSWRSYYYTLHYSAQRTDQVVISLSGAEDYFGSSDSASAAMAVTYDLSTGNAMVLSEILLDDTQVYDVLKQKLLSSLEQQKEQLQLYDDYAQIISSNFSNYLSESDCWYLSDEGLCFLFSPYDIAPHNAGIVTTTIAYSDLSGILQNNYLPEKQTSSEGSISFSNLSDFDPAKYQLIAELINSSDAEPVIMHTNGTLLMVTIEQGHMVGGVRYVRDAVIFHANQLSPTDALILQDDMKSENVLLLSYTIGQERLTFRITADEAGHFSLIPQ